MIPYLLKVFACGTIFYGLYHVFLSKEKTLVFNRFYLLAGLIAPFLIPLISITVTVAARELRNNNFTMSNGYPIQISEVSWTDYALNAAFTIAACVSIFLLFRFTKNLFRITTKIRESKKVALNGATISLSDRTTTPHSFLQFIFLNKLEYDKGKIEIEVLAHEFAHVRQKHSYDIILVEILQIFCWFNPILYLYKNAIKMNHELLADDTVVKEFGNVHNYQSILLQRAVSHHHPVELSSSFNYLTTKKRLIMLRKPFNKKRLFIATLALAPTFALALFAGCNRTEKEKALSVPVENIKSIPAKDSSIKAISSTSSDSVGTAKIALRNVPPPPPAEPRKKIEPPKISEEKFGPGATTAELEEYEKTAKNIQVISQDPYRLNISDNDLARMVQIHIKMNKAQRRISTPMLPPPPPVEPQPKQQISTSEKFGQGVTQAEMEEYESLAKKIRGIIDGSVKRTLDNDELTFISNTYSKMTQKQRATIKLLSGPPPPPAEPKGGLKGEN